MSKKSLNIIFPVVFLKQSIALLDPENTETTWEYYLIENLSCGLIRDDQKSPIGYSGCLADRFYQQDKNTWIFELRSLKWSDGSEVTQQEIQSWINNLRTVPHRHLRYLPQVKSAEYNPSNRQLKLEFPFEMGNSILHELSLADSGLMPPNYKTEGWKKTVGPYSVESWDQVNRVLFLVANKFSPLFHLGMPEHAILRNTSSRDEKERFFKSVEMDIVPSTALSDPSILNIYKKNSDKVFEAHPSSIAFFYFNFENKMARSFTNRLQLASAIARLRPKIETLTADAFALKPESQLIPEGFAGRIDDTLISKTNLKQIEFKAKIGLPVNLQAFPKLVAELKLVLQEEGIDADFDFRDSNAFSDGEFARVYVFAGNQMDPSGSWSFLLGPPAGLMNKWLFDVEKEFNDVFGKANQFDSVERSKALHKAILEKAIAIPFMIGSHRYFISSRVNASKWNKFDSRLRLYELEWK
jgi:hypothetical protein